MQQELLSLSLLGLTLLTPAQTTPAASSGVVIQQKSLPAGRQALASESMSLDNRHKDTGVNEVMVDNILLALHYLKGDTSDKKYQKMEKYQGYQKELNWEEIRKTFDVSFTLRPGEVFAFHDQVLPEFKDKATKTMNSRFMWDEGYKNDGWLTGDGVCDLATLMNWVASEAGLKVVAKVNHDFAPVPDIDRKYGTAIFYGNPDQNLYIQNSFDYKVKFEFKIDSGKVSFNILRVS